MRQSRQIVLGESRVLVCECPKRDVRLGRDPLTIAPGDNPVLVGPLRAFAAVFTPRPGRPDFALRLECDPLSIQAAMVDRCIDAELGQAGVDVLAPALAPADELVRPVPLAHLLAEALRSDRPHGQHHMGVRLRRPVCRVIPMHVEVRHHATLDELAIHEVARERYTILAPHLARDREFHFARQLRVFALLGCLDLVPKRRAIAEAIRRTLRQQDLRMHDARLRREILRTLQPVVLQLGSRTIGRRRYRAAAGRAGDHLGREVVDRHEDAADSNDHKSNRSKNSILLPNTSVTYTRS